MVRARGEDVVHRRQLDPGVVRDRGEELVHLRQLEAVREWMPQGVAGGAVRRVHPKERGQAGRHMEQVERRIVPGTSAGSGGVLSLGRRRARFRHRHRLQAGGARRGARPRGGLRLLVAGRSRAAGQLDPPERQPEGIADRAVRGPLSRRLPQAPFQDLAEGLVVGQLEAQRQRHLDGMHQRPGKVADSHGDAQPVAGGLRQRVTVGVPVGHGLPGRRGQSQLGGTEACVRRVGPRLAEMEQRGAETQQLDGLLGRAAAGTVERAGRLPRHLRLCRLLRRRRDQEQILRGEVEVRQPVTGKLLQAGQRLCQQRQDTVRRGAAAARGTGGLEADAFDHLHHQEGAAVGRQPRIQDQREVRVPEPGEPGGVGAEARGRLQRRGGVRRGRYVDQLDDDGLPVVDAAGTQDAPAPARGENLLESVVVGELTRRHRDSPGRTRGREPAS